jgi:hypothetical protein
MNDKLIELLTNLGADGVTVIYVYMAVETVQLFGIFLLSGWGIKKAWPSFRDMLNS